MKRTPLKRPTLAQVQAWDNRPRKPIGRNVQPARVGRKAKREEASWQLCKAIVLTRSGGYCEANIPGVCPHWKHGATQVHHIWPEDRDRGVHDPNRCLHLCANVHEWAHHNPLAAKKAGIFRPVVVPVPIEGTYGMSDEPIWPGVVSTP